MKGLLVFIMGSDCTAGGVTSGKGRAILIGHPNIFESSPDTPALVLVEDDTHRQGPGYLNVRSTDYLVMRVRAVPADVDGLPVLGGMFGGHFIHTSDSRFPYCSPIPVFDRFER